LDIMLTSVEEALSSLLARARAETNHRTDDLVEGLAIAVLAIRRYRQPTGTCGEARPRRGLPAWKLLSVMDALSREDDLRLALQNAAAACCLSRNHMARLFKASTGRSPKRWHLERRVHNAQRLLEVPGASLADVAQLCGFSDQSHLTNVFTRLCQTSPGTWRRRALDGAATIADAAVSAEFGDKHMHIFPR
jgi:transcriptional regulator GlxA family with amidase domain